MIAYYLFPSRDYLNDDPVLGPLSDNGGSSLTHSIGSCSPATNAGTTDNDAPETDQINTTRTGNPDIGAFEAELDDPEIPPTITAPENTTIECDASIDPSNTGTATATDKCDRVLSATYEDVDNGTSITRTWTATDGGGNSSTAEQTITFEDTTSPVIASTPETQTVDANANCVALLPDYTSLIEVSDNCDTELEITQSPEADTEISGAVNEITLTVTDDAGNTDEITFNVEVEDATAPVTPTLDELVGECSVTVYTPTATDACAGTITGTTSDDLFYDQQGTYTITWNFDDGNGNSIDVEQTVIVEDVTTPVIPTLDDITGECSAEATFTPTTTDACAGEITGTTSDDLFYDQQGTYTIFWNFDDGNGNSIDVEQNVIVEDVTIPTISCPENQEFTLLQGETVYTVSGDALNPVSADDNCGSFGVENDFTTTETLDAAEFPVGTTTVTWTVMDDAGNTAICEFDIQVNAFVGISDLSEIGINIYPNPTTGLLNIKLPENTENTEIIITDVTGKIVHQDNILGQEATINLDVATGVYLIRLNFDEKSVISTIIVE